MFPVSRPSSSITGSNLSLVTHTLALSHRDHEGPHGWRQRCHSLYFIVQLIPAHCLDFTHSADTPGARAHLYICPALFLCLNCLYFDEFRSITVVSFCLRWWRDCYACSCWRRVSQENPRNPALWFRRSSSWRRAFLAVFAAICH